MRRSRTTAKLETPEPQAEEQTTIGDVLAGEKPRRRSRTERNIDVSSGEKPVRASSEDKPETLELDFGDGFGRIVSRVLDLDIAAEHAELEQGLSLPQPPSRCDYGTLVDALDEAEERARRAAQLVACAKDARDSIEFDADMAEAPLRQAAVDELQRQKEKGERTKAVTIGDVHETMVVMYFEDFKEIKQKRGRAKHTVEYLEALAARWAKRADDLRAMVSRSRGDSG